MNDAMLILHSTPYTMIILAVRERRGGIPGDRWSSRMPLSLPSYPMGGSPCCLQSMAVSVEALTQPRDAPGRLSRKSIYASPAINRFWLAVGTGVPLPSTPRDYRVWHRLSNLDCPIGTDRHLSLDRGHDCRMGNSVSEYFRPSAPRRPRPATLFSFLSRFFFFHPPHQRQGSLPPFPPVFPYSPHTNDGASNQWVCVCHSMRL